MWPRVQLKGKLLLVVQSGLIRLEHFCIVLKLQHCCLVFVRYHKMETI